MHRGNKQTVVCDILMGFLRCFILSTNRNKGNIKSKPFSIKNIDMNLRTFKDVEYNVNLN